MMRLRALRLSEVRQFRKPMSVEGFGDGLNVLSGPNEHGKSTLVRALDALLTIKYNANNDQIRDLQPNSGGAPLIEAEFEADGRLWRLRKQFLSGKLASLLDVNTGALLRNADAEARLAALTSGALPFDRFGLLWVRQGMFAPARDADGSLAALLASEVDTVALDARARAMHARVRDELSELQSDKTRKPRGQLLACMKARDDAKKRLERAEILSRSQAERLVDLARLSNERTELMAPSAVAARQDALAATEKGYETAEASRRHRLEAAKQLQSAHDALQIAERERKSLFDDLAAWDRLTHERAAARDELQELQSRLESAEADFKAADVKAREQHTLIARLEQDVEVARAATRARQAALDRDRLAVQIAAVRSSSADAERARTTIATLAAATPDRVQALQLSLQTLDKIEAALTGVVPEVTVALETSATGQVVVDGEGLVGSKVFNPDRPLVIDIAGVGRITVAPNPAAVGPAHRAARDTARADIATIYAALRVSSLADAHALLADKLRAETEEREAEIRIRTLAPLGIDALLAAHAELSSLAASASAAIDALPVERALETLQAQKTIARQCDTDLEMSRQTVNTLAIERARSEANAAACNEQLTQLEGKIGDHEARDRAASHARSKLEAARQLFTEARIAADAWTANADADDVDILADALAAARAAIDQAAERHIVIDRQISGLEGELRAVSEEDIESELENARALAADTASRLMEIQAELSALELLDQKFQAMADAGRRELSGPILHRVLPYLTRLFPEAALELDEALSPSRLTRSGRSEDHSQLSDGTREQVAILVRLGLADFLADKNAAVPVILDDALVYSDDKRIASMFAVLHEASRRQQVIVLNCREQTFAPLARAQGATVLTLAPWAPSAIAA